MEFLIECMDDLSIEQQKVCLGFHLVGDFLFLVFEYIFDEVSSISVPIPLPELVSSAGSAASMASEEKV